jgi:hypothetical protein
MPTDRNRMANLPSSGGGIIPYPLPDCSFLGIFATFDRHQFHQSIPKSGRENLQQLSLVYS